jgi:lipopolysaccharide export system permease protein
VLAPLIAAGAMVSLMLVLNREFVIPRIAHAAFAKRDSGDETRHWVEPFIDHSTRISIDGRCVHLATRTIEAATFVLPAPEIAHELTVLEARSAKFFPARETRAAGWLLRDVSPLPTEVSARLTERGREVVLTKPDSPDLFIVSSVACDHLCERGSSYLFLSTPELLSRIRSPATGLVSIHRMVLHLHARMVQPLLNVLAVVIAIPLMVRRGSTSVVSDSAQCGFVLALVFGVTQGSHVLGLNQMVPADFAAWIPMFFCGTLAVWLSGWIRT